MRNFKLYSLVITLIFALLLAGCSFGEASKSSEDGEWPHSTTNLLIPFGAGGSLDTMMRVLAQDLERELGTAIRIDNRPGAATQIGTTQFVNQRDDGSVLFAGTQLYLSAGIVLRDAAYDIDDFAIVNIEQFDPATITVHKDSPYQTFEDLIEDVKANPGQISYSTIHGGPLHLTGVLLEDNLDISLNPVFYEGGGEMRNALLGQHVDFMVGNANGDTAIEDNVRVLAVATEEKMNMWPDAEPINDVLAQYDAEIPLVGSVRFLATHASFKEENPELFDHLTETYKKVFESERYQQYLKDNNQDEVSEYRGPEASEELNRELHELIAEYKDDL